MFSVSKPGRRLMLPMSASANSLVVCAMAPSWHGGDSHATSVKRSTGKSKAPAVGRLGA